MNYTFPLPPAELHHRYDPLFSAFNKGLCCTLIGLPLSARSGYLKFILEYDSKFLSEFINTEVYKFIVLEDTPSSESLVNTLAVKLLSLRIIDPAIQLELENRLKIHDLHLTLASIEAAVKSIHTTKLVIIVYETEKLLDDNPTSISALLRLWNIDRNQPHSKVHFCFIGSPVLLEKMHKSVWTPLRPALEENILEFPLFNTSEMLYLRSRIGHLTGTSISSSIHKLASFLSGGHTVLYRVLSQLTLPELARLQNSHSHPSVDSILRTIWDSLTTLDRQNGNFPLPLMPPMVDQKELTSSGESLPQLTSQQKLIFDYLNSHPNQVISRDEIAQVIWGKLSHEKYSDWAIDRSMSQLKKRLTATKFQIITIRNRGYRLSQ